ncbi:MAG: GNAT family N-acetyltransferase [Thermoleophilia bacterium]|nr:GNAT family N-acetyltransferase [Thermoleophilia bacterium]
MVSEDVRRFAEDPGAWGDVEARSGLTRILTDRYCLILGPVPTFTSVSHLRLDPDTLTETLAEVRAQVAEHGHREAIWWIGPSATPWDLADQLQAHGLVPDSRAGSEPHATSMVLTEGPPPAPAGVVARRVASLEEFVTAGRIADASFGAPEENARAYEAIGEASFGREQEGHGPRTYLAFLDGEPAGVGRGWFASDCPAVLMVGGGVLPQARGRGVYRALVRARWDDAVAAGTPALTAQAGAMSRPVLEHLGFQAVAEQEVLLDTATC